MSRSLHYEAPIVEDLEMVSLDRLAPEKQVQVGTELFPKEKVHLIFVLKRNQDVFAWSHKDMLGIDPKFVCHWIPTDPMIKPMQ